MNDNASGDPATLSAFKIVDLTTDPDTESASSLVPQTVDGQQAYAYVDYAYAGPAYNDPPQLASPQVSPATGTAGRHVHVPCPLLRPGRGRADGEEPHPRRRRPGR